MRQYMARLINAIASLAEGEMPAFLQREELGLIHAFFPFKNGCSSPSFLEMMYVSSIYACLIHLRFFVKIRCCYIAVVYARENYDFWSFFCKHSGFIL